MAKQYCLYCREKHEYHSWKYKRWPTEDGEVEGWVCGKHTKVSYPEFTSENIKDERKKFFKSITQPYREGQLSKEYLEAHGTKGINPTDEQIRKAKYTWKGLPGWRHRNKSY